MDRAYVLCAAFPSSRGASEIRATGNPAAVVGVENDEEADAGGAQMTNLFQSGERAAVGGARVRAEYGSKNERPAPGRVRL